jgi:Uma2 family endonuclease
MAETDWHRILMMALIETLELFFAAQPLVYVSGNILVFYEPGNRRKHVSPDVLVVKGVRKRRRRNYLLWAEKALDFVIELTSKSTKREDLDVKFRLYRDVLQVKEYFLFDPLGDYLDPQLQGYRLRRGQYVPIQRVRGRLPSQVLGLHLEPSGNELRLYDPATDKWLPTAQEAAELAEQARRREATARRREATARRREARARRLTEAALEQEAQARREAEVQSERLRREVEELRRRLEESGSNK